MATKTKVSEWDSVASNNILINGINIDEHCPPSALNNAIREVMAQIKDWQSGSSGDDWTSSGVLSVTGTLKLDGSLGANGQVLTSKGSTATPVWKTLGTMSNQNSSSVTTGDLNVTGALRLDSSLGSNGQVLKSLGTTATPVWTTLGTMSSQNYNNVNITGGSVNVTGSLKLDNSVGTSGQVLSSKGSSATPVWKTLSNMSNQSSNAVSITGGTITGLSNLTSTNLTATNATFTNTNTTGSVKFDNSVGGSGQVLTSQGSATPKWKTLGNMSAQNSNNVTITGGTIKGITNLEASGGNITATRVKIGANWSLVQHGEYLYFQHNSNSVLRLSSKGHLVAENNITAFKTV
jgi:hypothetical protein